MLSPSTPARLSIAFADDRLVAHACLLLPATLAKRLGLRELVDRHLDLGDAQGRANAGDKVATLVASVPMGAEPEDQSDLGGWFRTRQSESTSRVGKKPPFGAATERITVKRSYAASLWGPILAPSGALPPRSGAPGPTPGALRP